MARFKDFGTGDQDKPVEPLAFMLYGQEFSCKPRIQGKLLLDLISRSNAQTDPAQAAEIINDFFAAVLLAESYERFTALTSSDDTIVEMEKLSEIIAWLVEQYSDRPTQRPAVSSSGE